MITRKRELQTLDMFEKSNPGFIGTAHTNSARQLSSTVLMKRTIVYIKHIILSVTCRKVRFIK